MIAYLDTQVVVLVTQSAKKIPRKATQTLRRAQQLRISPATILELQMLREIGRLNAPPRSFVEALQESFDIEICSLPFAEVAETARALLWTRDPFDRLIVAQETLANCPLVTRDALIQQNFNSAIWD